MRRGTLGFLHRPDLFAGRATHRDIAPLQDLLLHFHADIAPLDRLEHSSRNAMPQLVLAQLGGSHDFIEAIAGAWMQALNGFAVVHINPLKVLK